MDSLVFVVPHHSTDTNHIQLLLTCIQSIRRLYPTNTIRVCKTSTSILDDTVLEPYDVCIEQTQMDGSHIYGAIRCIIRHAITKYIILHDSMVILKKVPDEVLEYPIYYLWHYNGHQENFGHRILEHCIHANIAPDIISRLLTEFQSPDWNGCFGPAFGGSLDALQKIHDILDLDTNIIEYCGRNELMCAERFIPLLVSYCDVRSQIPSLNGSIFGQPGCFVPSLLSFEEIMELGYSGYTFKQWAHRS